MSAVPKKKLCWNCEGNVSREIDNCPYCGVYLHAMEEEEEETNNWSAPYKFTAGNQEEIPSPPYQQAEIVPEEPINEQARISYPAISRLKQDVLPLLFLMTGSLFFLFGTVLFLFSDQGTLTLQWKGDHWIYFLGLSLPALFFGWKWLQDMDAP